MYGNHLPRPLVFQVSCAPDIAPAWSPQNEVPKRHKITWLPVALETQLPSEFSLRVPEFSLNFAGYIIR